MEVYAINTLSGREEPLEIDADATVSAMKRQCGEAFGFGEDVELSVSGQRVVCDGAERISNVAAFSGGCRVGVVRGVARFVAQLRSGAVRMGDIPMWARQRRECVLAMLACALERKKLSRWWDDITIKPHWVHPSLHGDKEVMLQYVKYAPKAFLRASAVLRSDADVVTAALQDDASMWRHVEDKILQEQRSVAAVAVPYCANSAVWLSDKEFVLEALDKEVPPPEWPHKLTALDKRELWPHVSKALQQDKEVAMKALLKNDVYFGDLCEALRGDKDFVMEVFCKGESVHFSDLSEALKQDKHVVMEAIRLRKLGGFHQLSATLQQDKEVAMRALIHKNVSFSDLSEVLREDKEFVIDVLESYSGVTNYHELSETLRDDKDIALNALRRRIVMFRDLSDTLRGDKEFVMEEDVCKEAVCNFHDLSTTLRGDKDIVMETLRRAWTSGGYFNIPPTLRQASDLSETLRGDKDVVMMALGSDVSLSIDDVSEALREDEDVLREFEDHNDRQRALLNQDEETVIRKVWANVPFRYLSEELRGDKEFILKVLRKLRDAGRYLYRRLNFGDMSEALRGDKEFVMKALEAGYSARTGRNIEGLYHLSPALKKDEDVLTQALDHGQLDDLRNLTTFNGCLHIEALRNEQMSFGCLSEDMRGEKGFAMWACCSAKHGDFHKLSPTLQQDKEVVMNCFHHIDQFLQLCPTLQQDKEVILTAFVNCGVAETPKKLDFSDLSEAMRRDKEIVMGAFPHGKLTNFHELSAALQQDKEVVMEAIRQKKVKLGSLSEALQADKAFVMQAITTTPDVYITMTGPLRQDKDVVLAAIAASPPLFTSMVPALRDDLDVAIAAIRANPPNFIYAGDSVRADKQAALAAFCPAQAGTAPSVLLPFASAELQADREVVLAAVRANEENRMYASPALQDLAASGP